MMPTRSWWKRWAQYVEDGCSSFVNGDPGSTAVGLVCVGFAPTACATGAALRCAAAATFH